MWSPIFSVLGGVFRQFGHLYHLSAGSVLDGRLVAVLLELRRWLHYGDRGRDVRRRLRYGNVCPDEEGCPARGGQAGR